MTTLHERLQDVLKEMRTAASQGVMPVKLHAWADRIESEAATALQSSGGEVVAYWVPIARVCSDGSWEDGTGDLILATEATAHERKIGTPLYASPAQPSGFVLVPVEPTEAMVAVADKMNPPFGTPEKLCEPGYCDRWRARQRKSYAEIYAAMLTAAPAPIEQENESE